MPGANVLDWPISLKELAPYYEKAEIKMGVTGETTGMPQLLWNNGFEVLAAGAKKRGYKDSVSGPMAINSVARGTEPGATVHVPEEPYTLEFVKASTVREGEDITIVSLGVGVHHALKAAKQLEDQSISTEVVELRTLVPLDRDHIFESVKKTGGLIVVDEDCHSYGVSGEVIASVVETDVTILKAPPQRVAYPDIPIPFVRPMQQ